MTLTPVPCIFSCLTLFECSPFANSSHRMIEEPSRRSGFSLMLCRDVARVDLEAVQTQAELHERFFI
ncbi:MAG: hypothetical protein ACR2GK_10020 [Gemmatimonadaceae bacterium]